MGRNGKEVAGGGRTRRKGREGSRGSAGRGAGRCGLESEGRRRGRREVPGLRPAGSACWRREERAGSGLKPETSGPRAAGRKEAAAEAGGGRSGPR